MDASGWDERYRSSDLVWGSRPNRWVEQELTDVEPGTAIDVAAGEGRNALWLASRGWTVTAVDFSEVALETGRRIAATADLTDCIDWVCADVTCYQPNSAVDLALICYLQLDAPARRQSVRNAAAALAAGGNLLVIGHDSTNLTNGTGGPQDPTVLFTADDIANDLDGMGLTIDTAAAVERPVDGAPRPAIDALLRAHRPTAT